MIADREERKTESRNNKTEFQILTAIVVAASKHSPIITSDKLSPGNGLNRGKKKKAFGKSKL